MPIPNPYQYQYRPEDDPVTVANQNGVTPQQLIQANPGGYPFSVGQTINIPMLPPAVQNNINQRGRGYSDPYAAPTSLGVSGTAVLPSQNADMRGRGYQAPGVTPTGYGTDDSWYSPARPANTTTNQPPPLDPNQPYGGLAPAPPDNTDYANTRAARYYAQAGTPFLQQQRWDPQARRYVSIGRLLRQGKLDLQGNWNRRSRRQRQTDSQQNRKQQQAQDFTLANSLINFSVGSG